MKTFHDFVKKVISTKIDELYWRVINYLKIIRNWNPIAFRYYDHNIGRIKFDKIIVVHRFQSHWNLINFTTSEKLK